MAALGALVALGGPFARSAAADDPEPVEDHSDPGVYVLVGTLAVDLGFTIYDVATIGDEKLKVYGFMEATLTVPQTLLFTSLAALDDEDRWIPASLALWTGALAVHGIYTLAREPSSAGASPRVFSLSYGSQF